MQRKFSARSVSKIPDILGNSADEREAGLAEIALNWRHRHVPTNYEYYSGNIRFRDLFEATQNVFWELFSVKTVFYCGIKRADLIVDLRLRSIQNKD